MPQRADLRNATSSGGIRRNQIAPPTRADEVFGTCSLDGGADDPGARSAEDLTERGGEAGVPVMNHELHSRPGILQVHERVPCLLDHPRLDRVPRGTQEPD